MKVNFFSANIKMNFLRKTFAFNFFVAMILCSVTNSVAQNVGINATGATPDNAAMLDVSSTTKAFLPPRVALTANNVFAPVAPSTSSVTAGFVVYNTATAGTSPNN
ncbi:MAG TPA: hypothetical protein VNY73_00080, partial [Bacteroidia bacterium]|nr:hypothetical protein [Bacteroidia bacterium]